MFRSKSLSEVIPAAGLYPANWHQEAFAQIVVCIHDDVTVGGIGGCRIFLRAEARSQWHSRFAAGDVWLPLDHAKAGHGRTSDKHSSPRSHWCPTALRGSKGQKCAANSSGHARCRLRCGGHKISWIVPCCPSGLQPRKSDRLPRSNLCGPAQTTSQSGADQGQNRRIRQGLPA